MLAAADVQFEFPGRLVLRGVTAEFPAGAVTAVIGPNGAGKSTLLRLLLGLLTPSRGAVTKDGGAVAAIAPRDRAAAMAYVPQSSQVAFPFNVRQVVRLGRYAAGRGDGEAAIARALTQVDIADRADDVFGQLSAGQQQRVTVARALAQLDAPAAGSRYLIADEPVSAMDPSHALRTMGVFESLAASGVGVVVVLHDLSLVLRYAQRVLMLSADGQVAGQGPCHETLRPALLERVYGVAFRLIADPENPARAAALIPQPAVPLTRGQG